MAGHVAIYMGNGQIVHASNSQDGIKISNDATYRTIVSVRRLIIKRTTENKNTAARQQFAAVFNVGKNTEKPMERSEQQQNMLKKCINIETVLTYTQQDVIIMSV